MKLSLLIFLMVYVCGFVAPASAVQAVTEQSAVILMYHNVADDTPASTSVSPETFEKHLQYLSDNGFTVWPLYKTLLHLATGKAVPDKTVVFTFDDAYRSVYDEAFPLLKDRGWPFTVFVTTRYISDKYVNYMSWQQLREVQQFSGEIGNHSLSHPHLIRQGTAETDEQWYERITGEIQQAQSILQQQTGNPVRAVAYPYGEYNRKLKALLWQLGYFGLGQHSGAVSASSDMQALPRYPMATGFDGLDDFAVKVNSRNLPVTILSPADGVVAGSTDIPELILRLQAGDYEEAGLACYAAGQGRIHVVWHDTVQHVVKVTANEAIKSGRVKYNCTAPSKSEKGVFYWFSFLWMKPEADGRWYRE